MLGLSKLTPWIATGAFIAGLMAGAWCYDRVIVPGRLADARKAERDLQLVICRDTTNTAAAAAQEAARRKIQSAGEAALEAARKAAIAREASRVTQIEELEQENSRYAKTLVELGRSCPLDDDAAEWLRNKPDQ